MIKLLFVLFIISFSAFAQYTKYDSALVLTTFTREFDRAIINEYLTSSDPQKIKAALLSVSHSEDTSFVKDIIQLDYEKYSKEICFALGQLGPCNSSEEYLFNKYFSGMLSSPLFQALGKCGSEETLDVICSIYNPDRQHQDGISLALFYFYSRGIKAESSSEILMAELTKNPDKQRQADAAFAVYRTSQTDYYNEKLLKEIDKEINYLNSEASINKLYYMLGTLRKNKFFPDNKELFNKILELDDHILRVEAAKLLAFYPFSNENEINQYLSFFDDSNPNVTRTAAIALKDIKLPPNLRLFLKSWLEASLRRKDLPANTTGELYNSFISLYKPDFVNITDELALNVEDSFVYNAIGNYSKSPEALPYLIYTYETESDKNKLIILQSLLNFQENFRNEKGLQNFLMNAIASDSPPVISIAADGLDSLNIILNTNSLHHIIPEQVNKYYNNPEYIESIFSLVNLAEKVDSSLADKVIKELKKSDLFSIQSFIAQKEGLDKKALKDASVFEDLWADAFSYSYAEVETSKGTFTIKLLPEYAPVSVGNFCKLATEGYFSDNIFHRVVPSFVIQGGDPTQTGWGGPGYEIVSETSPLEYFKGMVGMASAGKDTEGSQWFITTGYYPHLNGKYTIFGEITSGMDVVNQTDQNDTIKKIKLIP